MPSLKLIKKRITSVKNTQKITRAMKLVSAAKLRRATERAHSSRPYEAELKQIVSRILAEHEWKSPLSEDRAKGKPLSEKPQAKIALVVISTDRGLAGSLNANLFKLVTRRIAELNLPNSAIEIIALGKKANDYFKKRGFTIRAVYPDLSRKASHALIKPISEEIRKLFMDKIFDRIEVFYSQFKSALVQIPSQITLLPFVVGASEETPAGKTAPSFKYEPNPLHILEALVPILLDFQLYRMILESIASEHGARMAAMESATKNAKDMIGSLTLQRNRARQAAITKELMEIIGGAEALSA